MKVYQIWWETSIGSTFSTYEKALNYLIKEYLNDCRLLDDDYEVRGEPTTLKDIQEYGYPNIVEIEVDVHAESRDR